MSFDMNKAWDLVKNEVKENAEVTHAKTNEFHDNYISKVIPDCGKYGDAAKFVAEMVPGVSEYNVIKDGDWQAFAIAAGIDIAALAVGVVTAGAGYTAAKGGTTAAKTGVKVAVKEVAEAGAKKGITETAEAGVKKVAKDAAEAGAEKVVKETAEAGVEKVAKETAEAGTEKVAKEVAETGSGKVAKVEETNEVKSQIEINKLDGIAREEKVLEKLVNKYGDKNVIREALLRDKDGIPIKDIVTGEARRIDFIAIQNGRIIESIEVTSETADKVAQIAKETRILEQAKEVGGAFIKNPYTKELIEFPTNIVTEIRRLP